ncbi:HNH endonuclease signature motif containing protein, partial [Aspergillus glaucus CBS 516.65]
FFRTYSVGTSGRESAFRDGVRGRDRKCMISGGGGLLASLGVWTKLEAAHVFPLECENLWNEFGYSSWITNMNETTGVSKINSVQNALLIRRGLYSH